MLGQGLPSLLDIILISMAISLPLTLVFEACVYFFAGLLEGRFVKRDLLLLVLVNVVTNPVVVLVFWLTAVYTDINNPYIMLVPLEVLAVIVEWLFYKRYGKAFSRPFLFSLVANVFSFGMGAVVGVLMGL